MYRLLLLSLLVACEQVAAVGNPLEPVVVTAPDRVIPEVTADLSETQEATEEAPFSISSEELAENAKEETKAEPVTAVQIERASVSPPTQAASTPQPSPSPAPPEAAPSSHWPQTLGKSWPVRLVTTVPNASPPRAILGLPNGKEVVVNPGTMVPEFGLVVVAISPGSAELAKIAPAGDHATIESVTLRAQY
jgi:hypothetical protein